jgi:hypothetical protein
MTLIRLTMLAERLDEYLTELWSREIDDKKYVDGLRTDKFRLKDGSVVTVKRDEPRAQSRYYKVEDPGGAHARYSTHQGKNKKRMSVDWLVHEKNMNGMPTRGQVASVQRVTKKVLGRADKMKMKAYTDPVPFGRMPVESLLKMYQREGFQKIKPRADLAAAFRRKDKLGALGALMRKPKLR